MNVLSIIQSYIGRLIEVLKARSMKHKSKINKFFFSFNLYILHINNILLMSLINKYLLFNHYISNINNKNGWKKKL